MMAATSVLTIGFLIFANLALIWLLLAAPIGLRKTTVSRKISGSPAHIWSALFPLGSNATWDGSYLSVVPLQNDGALLELSWEGRDGKPIQRTVKFSDVIENQQFTTQTSDDTSLDGSFWQNHSETVRITANGSQTLVTISESDRYKGLAFLGFRYFKNRRQLANLEGWARTGVYKSVGVFEKAPMQIAMAMLSALLMWPFFGLTTAGFILSVTLTCVVAFHELGHMFAFRVMGHQTARMIFIPILGGIALGGRPYDRHFEVGFSALMGAGFSVFPVAMSMALYDPLKLYGFAHAASLFGIFALIGGIFNLANLVPIWKFDGGQVIRQIFDTSWAQGVASFTLLCALMAVCKVCGLGNSTSIIIAVVFVLLSLITTGLGFKPRHKLHPMTTNERILITAGLLATFCVHSYATIWGVHTFL